MFTVRHTLISVALLSAASTTHAFVSPTTRTSYTIKSSLSALPQLPDILLSDETLSPVVEAARAKFWFYFLAGSGAGGIGAAQLPSIFKDRGVAIASIGEGKTLGGETFNGGPLVGSYYNNEISANDVADVIQKAPTADAISKRSTSESYMASKGYIVQSDFIKEMKNCKSNPLASYAVFDAISSGKGGVVSPVVYEEKLAKYRGDGSEVSSSFVGDLNGFLAVKAFAFFGLVFCLLVDIFLFGKAGIEGWL